jgi:hypothetical protein
MKNYLPIYLVAAGAYVIYFLKNKAKAGSNLKYEPIDIAIDLERTKDSFYTKIYYNVKLKLINSENASINVKGVDLNVNVEGTNFGNINKTEDFIVNAQSSKIIVFQASFSSLSALMLVKKIIQEGLNINVRVTGTIDTDLGTIQVDYKKKISGPGEEGINGPLTLRGPYFLYWKKETQPVGETLTEVYEYILNCLNTGAKLNDFNIKTKDGENFSGPVFLKQIKKRGFTLENFSLN